MSTLNVDIIDYSSNVYQDVTVSGAPIKLIAATNQVRVGTRITPGYNTGQYETTLGINNLNLCSGSSNTAIGFQTLSNSTTGFQNTGLGAFALQFNTTGNSNTAVGLNALQRTTTGSNNTAIGSNANYWNTTGYSNVTLGGTAGFYNSTGADNVYIGATAGYYNTTGGSNIFIGGSSGYTTTSGNNNIFLGNFSSGATATVSNSITLGNTSSNVLRCNVTSITSLSDARDKEDVVELAAGLEFVKELNPVSFVWNDREETGKHGVKDFGFIAQDLKATQEKHDMAETLGLVYEENPEKLEASYGKLIPILVKAIKELSAKVEALESKKKK